PSSLLSRAFVARSSRFRLLDSLLNHCRSMRACRSAGQSPTTKFLFLCCSTHVIRSQHNRRMSGSLSSLTEHRRVAPERFSCSTSCVRLDRRLDSRHPGSETMKKREPKPLFRDVIKAALERRQPKVRIKEAAPMFRMNYGVLRKALSLNTFH